MPLIRVVAGAFHYPHHFAVPALGVIIVGDKDGVNNARYPKTNSKDNAQYKRADAPSC